jgi:dual specificity MAP kinase phosphatase
MMIDPLILQEWNDIDHIHDNLYVGTFRSAKSYEIINKYDISAIVNVSKSLDDPAYGGIVSIKIGLIDGPSDDNYPSLYRLAAEAVITLLNDGHNVLVHCHEGISRSPAICFLVLIKKYGFTPSEADDLILQKRPIAMIHRAHYQHIEEVLEDWEETSAVK